MGVNLKIIFLSVNVLLIILILYFIGSILEQENFENPNQLYINEVMVSNGSTLLDANGNYSDWIELYNDSNLDINLANYYLTDHFDDLIKWKFPKRVIVPAKGYLIIWASGKNKTDSHNDLHTNFSINSDGEPIILVAPDGSTIVDLIKTKRTSDNISYGRYPDGSDNFKNFYLTSTTPGKANSLSQNLMHSPNFSQAGGFYQNQFNLSLSADPGAKIYYTLDGSKPTENSLIYNEEILICSRVGESNYLSLIPTSPIEWMGPPKNEVFKGTVVRAIAIKDGKSSEIATHTYFIDKTYNISVTSISTNMENLFDEKIGLFINDNSQEKGIDWEREGHIEFFDESNQIGFSQEIGIRVHGGYTRYAPIKSLRIYARDDQGYFNYQLFPDKELTVFNSFLLRNGGSGYLNVPFRDAFAQSLIKDVTNVDIQYYRPSIVFINGEYWGIYNIRDRFDDDYIYNHYGTSDIDMLSDLGEFTDYGSDEDFYKLLQLLGADLNYGNNYDYVKEKLDVDNFTDYHIAQIYYMNIDQPGKNVKFWRTRKAIETGHEETDGKWRWLLFDTDMGLSYDTFSNYERNGLIFSTNLDYHGATRINPSSNWPTFAPNTINATFPLRAILKNDEFRINFINRFADLLNTAFAEDIVVNKLAKMKQEVSPYMDDHINRWSRPTNKRVWENDVEKIRTFAENRPTYMREHISDYFGLSGTSTITTFNDLSEGNICINSIEIIEGTLNVNDASNWTGIYFNDIPIKITAKPKVGYTFDRWISNNINVNGSTDESIILTLNSDITLNAIYKIDDTHTNKTTNTTSTKDNQPLGMSIIIPLTSLSIFLVGYIFINKQRNE
ncbi:MAG: hypothetical protein K0Q49_1395 [Haloplasmataceae bacterium]|jgi:hypothetical protein|nr:hypothetical protein [Haloplasmataceae bacterium]